MGAVDPGQLRANRHRIGAQPGVGASTLAKLVLTAVAGEQQRPGQQLVGITSRPVRWLRAVA